uniref:Uncharacterized protein n=1 Tax=Cacopsylla melanoneura TaxID=428564 RepID=A0A8D8W6T9_9HEMI
MRILFSHLCYGHIRAWLLVKGKRNLDYLEYKEKGRSNPLASPIHMQSAEAKNTMFRHVWDRFFFYLEYIHVCSVLYLYGYTRRLSGRHFWDRIDFIFGFMTLNLCSFVSLYILSVTLY